MCSAGGRIIDRRLPHHLHPHDLMSKPGFDVQANRGHWGGRRREVNPRTGDRRPARHSLHRQGRHPRPWSELARAPCRRRPGHPVQFLGVRRDTLRRRRRALSTCVHGRISRLLAHYGHLARVAPCDADLAAGRRPLAGPPATAVYTQTGRATSTGEPMEMARPYAPSAMVLVLASSTEGSTVRAYGVTGTCTHRTTAFRHATHDRNVAPHPCRRPAAVAAPAGQSPRGSVRLRRTARRRNTTASPHLAGRTGRSGGRHRARARVHAAMARSHSSRYAHR